VKTFVSIFSITLFLVVLCQCNPLFEQREGQTVPVSTVKPNLESEKRIVAEHLRDCSNDIERRINDLDGQIAKADKKAKTSLIELRKKLVREKKKVDRSLKEIEQSTNATWKSVNKKSGEILTNSKIEVQKIEERVEDLMNG
jgi:hypothetical protein